MYREQYLVSLGVPLDAAVSLCHSANRDGTIDEIMEQIKQDCSPKHKCNCNPPCAHCSCRNSYK